MLKQICFSLFIISCALSSHAENLNQTQYICELLLGNKSSTSSDTDIVQLASAQRLLGVGAPALVAARLAAEQPELGARILKRAERGPIEWITLYRGFSGTMRSHDPYYFKLNPFANKSFLASSIAALRPMPQGLFASDDQEAAQAYAEFGLYADEEVDVGTVVELRIPRFMVNRFFNSSYIYVPRSNAIELDLWITRYRQVDSTEKKWSAIVQGEQQNSSEWNPYEEFFFSDERQNHLPTPTVKAMNRTLNLWNRLLTKIKM